jgi:hypothetical protein
MPSTPTEWLESFYRQIFVMIKNENVVIAAVAVTRHDAPTTTMNKNPGGAVQKKRTSPAGRGARVDTHAFLSARLVPQA